MHLITSLTGPESSAILYSSSTKTSIGHFSSFSNNSTSAIGVSPSPNALLEFGVA